MRYPWLLLALVGCGGPTTLPLPSLAGIEQWMLVLSDEQGTQARILAEEDHFQFELLPGTTLEAIGFRTPTALMPGPVLTAPTGDALPEHDAVLIADLEGGSWSTTAEPSDRATDLRLPRSDDCSQIVGRTERLVDRPGPVQGMIALEPDWRLVISNVGWFRATAETTEPFPDLVQEVTSAAVDPSGTAYLAANTAIWSLRKVGATWTATIAWPLDDGTAIFSLAAPRPGVVFGLTDQGTLLRADVRGVVAVHAFDYTSMRHNRGVVIADGDGVLAGAGSDPTFVAIDASDALTLYTLPESNEGAVSLARTADYGLVVGTGQGILRAQSLGFDALPDPLQQMPRGIQLRAILPDGDRLFFSGNSGLFGEVTPMHFICTSDQKGSAVLRLLSRLGDTVLAAGGNLDVDPNPNLTRFRIEP